MFSTCDIRGYEDTGFGDTRLVSEAQQQARRQEQGHEDGREPDQEQRAPPGDGPIGSVRASNCF
jgi:hypothetical protein